jgi:hypothetical protein
VELAQSSEFYLINLLYSTSLHTQSYTGKYKTHILSWCTCFKDSNGNSNGNGKGEGQENVPRI